MPKCANSVAIVSGPATRVKTPTVTSSTAGIAKKLLYAKADASIIALSSMNFFAARTKTAFQSASVRSRRPGSGTFGSCSSGFGGGPAVGGAPVFSVISITGSNAEAAVPVAPRVV